ncbi:MAG TPA: hypothetical protein VLM79_32530, partial [Kofleriaceae bacterium]|nr:hypothetical protein [Kofleriaceae bacterium]
MRRCAGHQGHAVDRAGPLPGRREPDIDAARREHAEQPIAAALRAVAGAYNRMAEFATVQLRVAEAA